MYRRGVVLFLVYLAWAQASLAQTLDGDFKGWRVYTLQRDGQKLCYLSSSPTDKVGSVKRRGDPYFLVTYRNPQTSEISVSAGYPYRPQSNVTLVIDGKHKHALFTSEKTPEIAWAKDAAEDRQVVESMGRGNKLTVAAQGPKKAASTDTYMLPGFAEAHKRMQELCQKTPEKAAKPARGQKVGSDDTKSKESKKDDKKAPESKGAENKGKETTSR